ncbi:MAG: [FeFe] hydrogenase H-cluster maturation GTPase HydF [Oscillospiraceae bacterium]
MSLNSTPTSDRVHIGIFGRRNAGKSSLINALTNQKLAIVSDIKGTTTDPVYKTMELLPLGPVVFIDTPGIDDEGELGEQRIKASVRVLAKTDIALLVTEDRELSAEDKALLQRIKEKNIPYIIVHNKCEKYPGFVPAEENGIAVSASEGINITELRELIAKQHDYAGDKVRLVGDIIRPGDLVGLVVPIDKAAPKGRLILPQQMAIRDILDAGAISVVMRESELEQTLQQLGRKPDIVITDSQAFGMVSKTVPRDIPLTSFSILMARYKGILRQTVMGVRGLDKLKDGDRVLISEGCTHHRQCGDIGTVKLPAWIKEYTKKELDFEFSSGTEFPEDIGGYGLIVHCGGCMLNEREVRYRLACAEEQGVPMTNYGILIAYVHGILKRSVEPFEDIAELLE